MFDQSGLATPPCGTPVLVGSHPALAITPADLRARFVDEEPQGYLTMYQAMRLLSVSRQTVLQRVKRGELQVVHVKRGKKKGLLIKAIPAQPTLFDLTS